MIRPLNYAAAVALYTLRESPRTELVGVMVVAPMAVTVAQLWWIDSFIQRQDTQKEHNIEQGAELISKV